MLRVTIENGRQNSGCVCKGKGEPLQSGVSRKALFARLHTVTRVKGYTMYVYSGHTLVVCFGVQVTSGAKPQFMGPVVNV